MNKCKICRNKTGTSFNIDFKMVHICESCATSIFIQQAQWYANSRKRDNEMIVAVLKEHVEHPKKPGYKRHDILDKINELENS